ncbi:clathrin interactor EPSIN 2 [Dendrobium catenatum]|uniref:clathrin interactor EPSIN 2 n=1 Tax=Dendrobium catenatum TaxID=906689 RepID=UPI0009F4595C|nr:clathrin interactor EPSIN 2 [Dendrobium catenatum]
MKKAFDQTVRELKREVNKKVLKVPGIEQKILDATSNEPWGPHGSLLADIAQATRNYPEHQIIMHVIWKRLNDTGKNWRHVYKSLTILEYLVGHGSERVIDEIREHAYQISTLSDFQYLDSSGKDQGNNVRRKSQALVSLVNDKEKIQEVRQKALSNKDKYRATYSSSGSYKPGSYSSASGFGDRYDDDRYEGRYGDREDDRNGYGRGYRDDDRYSRGGDFNRDGDGFGRDSDEHSGRGSYKNDDNRGGRGNDDYQFGPRSKSFDKDKDHSYEEDDSYSYRNGGDRANDASPNERNLEPKLSEQNAGAPPSYESAVRNENNIVRDERDGGVGTAAVPKSFSPAAPKASSPQNNHHGEQPAVKGVHSSPMSMDDTSFDEFDPRGFTPAVNFAPLAASSASPAASGSVVDLFGNSSSLDPVNSLALVLTSPTTTANESDVATTNSGFGMNFVALSSASPAPTEDPFGDGPFKAIPQENFPNPMQSSAPVASAASSFPPSASSMSIAEPVLPAAPMAETSLDFDFGDSLSGLTYMPSIENDPMYSANPTLVTSESPLAQPNIDGMGTNRGPSYLQTTNSVYGHSSFLAPGFASISSPAAQPFGSTNVQIDDKGFLPQQLGPSIPQGAPLPMQSVQPMVQLNMPAASRNLNQPGLSSPLNQRANTAISGPSSSKQSNDTFETKSSVWADTLNRGLVNLNISGSKINPLADIGVDFDSINRLERRKEKDKGAANPLTSTVTMGKAMGSGSGIGRAGAGAGAMGMGIGGYGGAMNQPMGMGGGMGMNMGMGMGMGMGGSMRPQPEMQSPSPGFPGSGYNSMMGMGGYGSHQTYGGGYR